MYDPHIHLYRPGEAHANTGLLLLHGTGGDEHELLHIAHRAAPGLPVLSLRGKVVEGELYRHFARFADGQLDEADLRAKVDELAAAIAHFRDLYGFGPVVGMGYSNGANLIAAALLLRPGLFTGAVLMRSVLPIEPGPEARRLDGLPVLVVTGEQDDIAPLSRASDLVSALEGVGAQVDHKVLATGHALVEADARVAGAWLAAGSAGVLSVRWRPPTLS